MALAGQRAIIIWNDIAPEGRDEFYDWHIHEHIPERLAVPGFRRGSRSIAISPQTKPEFVTLYEIADASVATSAAYLARLNAPTDWTKRATSHFRNTARALTKVLLSEGAGSGGVMATIRFDDSDQAARSICKSLREAFGAGGGREAAADLRRAFMHDQQLSQRRADRRKPRPHRHHAGADRSAVT